MPNSSPDSPSPISSPQPPSEERATEGKPSNGLDKKENDRAVLEQLLTKLRASLGHGCHGMGAFADTLMENVELRSFCRSGSSLGRDPKHRPSTTTTTTTRLVVSFPVTPLLCNGFDTLHGGAQATAVDIFTSVLLAALEPVPSVTADLHVSCLAPAPLESIVVAVCSTVEQGTTGGMRPPGVPGEKLRFVACDLFREDKNDNDGDGDALVPIAKGLHTKYVLKQRTKGFVERNDKHRGGNGTSTKQVTPRSKL